MDLIDKLKYYQPEQRQNLSDQSPPIEKIALDLQGKILEENALPIIKIERFEPYSDINPALANNNPFTVNLPLLSKNQFQEPISLNDLLAFDLETTGLAGGTGTYPFLMGFGIFEKKGIRIYQYFLPEFGREVSAYLDLKTLWAEKNTLLSYNGKSFDYPLIRNRMILNRVNNPLEQYNHLDLLPIARRLWKNVLPSCSLDTIEEHIFYMNRWRDIDGALIPQAYFEFLQNGTTTDIKRIINHNQLDIISLARLLFYLHQTENNTITSSFSDHEKVAMFNIAVTISDFSYIDPLIGALVAENKKIPAQSLKKYSLLLKRQKKWQQALKIWQNFIDIGEEMMFSYEELAKYYEHRENNIPKAIDYAERARDFISVMEEIQIQEDYRSLKGKFNRRLKRLNIKLKKS